MTYSTTINVDPQRVQDMIIGAFEGGSNYWLGNGRVELVQPAYADMPPAGVVWYGNELRNVFAEPDFKVTIQHDGEELVLDQSAITKGLLTMATRYGRHFSDLISENDDADTADVFLQCCLFGELVYG